MNGKLTKHGLLNINAEQRRDFCRKHGKVIDEVDFLPGGVCCDIYLEKDTMTFSAEISEQTFQDKEGTKVKQWAYDRLKTICDLKWVPVISVLDVGEHSRTDYQYNRRRLELHEIKVDLHRFYVASMLNGDVRSVEWEVPPEKRLTSQKSPSIWVSRDDKLVIKEGKIVPLHDDETHILPYSEGLWNGLAQLCNSIDTLQVKLHAMLQTDEGLRKLEDVGAGVLRLLEAPKPDEH